MKTYMGIDLGTSGVKIGIINEKKEVIFQESQPYPIFVNNLNSEQNPNDWWKAIIKIFSNVPQKIKSKLDAISFSGQMHGMLALDSDGNLLRNAILWNDTRNFNEVSFLNQNSIKKKIIEETGNVAIEGFTAPKILWFKKNENERFKKTKIFLLPKDWLIYKFTKKFVTEPSDASGTLLFNVKRSKWSKFMIDIIGISKNQLPKIVPSSSVVSKISNELAEYLNISKDIKIVAGGADQAINAISMGAYNEGDVCISLGTSGVVLFPTRSYKTPKNNSLHSFSSVTGSFYQMGVTLSFGGSIKWFLDSILIDSNFSKNNNEVIKKNSIIYMPYISGERTPINDAKVSGMFLGLRREHDSSIMFQSILEGTSFSIYQIYRIIMDDIKINSNNIYISGGASQSKIVTVILATLFNKNILVAKNNLGPFYGAALLAQIGSTGSDFRDLNISNMIGYNVVKPNKDIKTYLNKKFSIWNDVYKETKQVSYRIFKDLLN